MNFLQEWILHLQAQLVQLVIGEGEQARRSARQVCAAKSTTQMSTIQSVLNAVTSSACSIKKDHSIHNGVIRHVFGHHGPGAHKNVAAYGHAADHGFVHFPDARAD